jgi:SAM-dependent methyltransferase
MDEMPRRGFKDHFSGHAADYARARPAYPEALFAWLATVAPARTCAWDAGTGNGQAARGLASYFNKVVATDPSAEQIAQTMPHPRIDYRVEPAEQTSLPHASIDLVTVAQALHWLDFEAFYAEVRRVCRPESLLAVWAYSLACITPEVDAVVQRFYAGITGPYWPPERRWFDEGYETLPFPFNRLPTPDFQMEQHWTPADLLAYLGTWSGTKRYQARHGHDPRDLIYQDLLDAWGEALQPRPVRWPLHLLVGRVGER